jgi:hypothetical protein
MDFENTKVVDREPDHDKRLFLEAWHSLRQVNAEMITMTFLRFTIALYSSITVNVIIVFVKARLQSILRMCGLCLHFLFWFGSTSIVYYAV